MSPLNDIITLLNQNGWRVHNLYQGESQWEARIKHAGRDLVYGNGEGPTPFDALSSALEAGELRLQWRPIRGPATVAAIPVRRSATTTDDLMSGLDI